MAHRLPKTGSKIIVGGIILFCTLFSVQAAEIRLKNVPVRCSEPLVILTDIADVLPADNENAEPLRQTVLFPTPADSETRTLNQWELRTILSQLGVNSRQYSMSGAEKITITGVTERTYVPANPNGQFVVHANYIAPTGTNPAAPAAVRADTAPLTAGITEDIATLLEKQVAQALGIYLNFTNKIERSWEVSLKLSPEQIKLFATNGQIADITGGQIPFTGVQQFHVRLQNNVTITVDAVITLPTEVVVVRRSLPKGHIINESDVMLQRADGIKGADFFTEIKSVIGKEINKPVRELSVLTQSSVRMPLWIRRGEIVTVKATKDGFVVRSEATALQDGVEGDTITVSKIELNTAKKGKKEEAVTYLARVCAPKTVEVFVK